MISLETLSKRSISLSIIILVVLGATWFLVVSNKDGDLFGGGNVGGSLPIIDFKTLQSGDGYLACPEDVCAASKPDQNTPIFEYNIARVSRAFFAYTDINPLIETRSRDLTNWQFDLSEYVEGKTFPDLITVKFQSLGVNQTTVLIYSRSVVGKSTKSIHQERVERWLSHLANNMAE